VKHLANFSADFICLEYVLNTFCTKILARSTNERDYLLFVHFIVSMDQRVINDLSRIRLSRRSTICLLAHPLPSVSSTGDTQED
jgi:hypothetical protein